MPKYVMLSTLGPDGHARLRDQPDRLRQVNADVEAMGVRVLEQFALLGPYDFLNILEAPDEITMAKVASTLAARGTLKTMTLTAIDVEDFIEAMGAGTGPGWSLGPSDPPHVPPPMSNGGERDGSG